MNKKLVSNEIAEAMRSIPPPWYKTILHPNAGFPTNPFTLQRFSGISTLLLLSTRYEFKSKFWATYKQWNSLSLKVKKKPENVDDGKWGTKILGLTVFNAEQVFGNGDLKFFDGERNLYQKPAKEYLVDDKLITRTYDDWFFKLYEKFIHSVDSTYFTEDQKQLIINIGQSYLEMILALPHQFDELNYNKWIDIWLLKISKNSNYIFEVISEVDRIVEEILNTKL